LLESMAVVHQSFQEQGRPTPMLLLVGGGTPTSAPVKKYQTKAKDLGIEDHVIFAGLRPSETMPAFMQVSSVLVSPRIEGNNTPLKIYSYMAANRPIVATSISSHTQVLDESNAFIAEPIASKFAEALLTALDNSDVGLARSQKRAETAKKLVEERYSAKQFREKLKKVYSNILD